MFFLALAAGLWYSMYDYSMVDASSGGRSRDLTASITDGVPLHIVGGSIVPTAKFGMTTSEVHYVISAVYLSPLMVIRYDEVKCGK